MVKNESTTVVKKIDPNKDLTKSIFFTLAKKTKINEEPI